MDYDRREAADSNLNVQRLTRVLDGIEKDVKEAKDALAKYKKDPGKYAPQADNLASNLSGIYSATRVGLRALGKQV